MEAYQNNKILNDDERQQ